ncbi:low temperature requirement protein A [Oligoflexaceae bacterium]|nr:low temperature requirement protein A [Oligoflexaceae bacterium]
MQKRWLQKPAFHVAQHGSEKKPSWLELFYDLVFVVAFIQLGNGLANNVSVEGFVTFFLVFVPLWVIWTGQTYFINRFTIDDVAHRLTIFLAMFCIAIMGVSAPYITTDKSHFFSIATSLCLFCVSACNFRAFIQLKEGRQYSSYWAKVFFIAGVLWLGSCWVPKPYEMLMCAVGVLFIIVAPFSRTSREHAEQFAQDREHLSERYGILTIIVLGESFVKVISDLSHHDLDFGIIIQACFSLTITCSIWWLYFDDVAGTKLKEVKLAPLIWLYGHMPLQAAITATGVAVYKVGSLDLSEPIPLKYRVFIAVCLAIVLFSIAAIDWVSERKHQDLKDNVRINIRLTAGVLILLLVPATASLSGTMFTVILTSIFAGLVAFDMIIAPFEQESIDKIESESLQKLSSKPVSKRLKNISGKRGQLNKTIIKGVPNELRHDFYSFLLDGGWLRVFVVSGLCFLFVNIVFACLFMFQPGSITNAADKDFLAAFFFSVQTMSTIGYGVLSPATDYGNVLVTIEAAVGLLSVALITGVIFAKASRPQSGITFSDQALLVKRDGKMNLSFRVGNARGTEVIDASLSVSAVKDYVSQEGEHLRQLYDLKLVRSRTPLFRLTWSVFHEINEESPLYGIDWNSESPGVWAIVATIVGHEETYGQTVYSRKIFYPHDIKQNEKFIDILSQMDDGRLVVDFESFHKTTPVNQT